MMRLFYKFRIFYSVLMCLVIFLPAMSWGEDDPCEAVKQLSTIEMLQERYLKRPIRFSEDEISKKVDKCWRCVSIDSDTNSADCNRDRGFANDFGGGLADLAISLQTESDKLHKFLYFTDTALSELNKDEAKSYTAIVRIYNSFVERLKSRSGITILDSDQLEKIESIPLGNNAQEMATEAISRFSKNVLFPVHNNKIEQDKCTAVEILVDRAELRKRIFETHDSNIIKTEADQSDFNLQKYWQYEIGCGETGENACAVELGRLLAEVAVTYQGSPKNSKRVAVVIKNALQKFLDAKYYLSCVTVYNAVSSHLNAQQDSLKGILSTIAPLLRSVNYDSNFPRTGADQAVDIFLKNFLTPLEKAEQQTLTSPIEKPKNDIAGIDEKLTQKPQKKKKKNETTATEIEENEKDGKMMRIVYFVLLFIAIFAIIYFLKTLIKNSKRQIKSGERLKKSSLQNSLDQTKHSNTDLFNDIKSTERDNVKTLIQIINDYKNETDKRIDHLKEELEKRIEDAKNSVRDYAVKRAQGIAKIEGAKNYAVERTQGIKDVISTNTEGMLLEIEKELFKRKKANIKSNDVINEKIREIKLDKDFINDALDKLPELISDPALKERYHNLSHPLKKYKENFRELEKIIKYESKNFKTKKEEIVQLRLWLPLLDRLEDEGYMRFLSDFDVKNWVEQKFVLFADAFLLEYQKALSEGKDEALQETCDTIVSILGKAEIEPILVRPKKERLDKEIHLIRSRAENKNLPDEIIVSVVKSGFKQAGQILNKAEVIVNKNG